MSHRLVLDRIEPVTHDTNHLVFPRPEGFEFTPGQATELTLDRDGWRDEGRPFTFVSQPGDDTLEFVIKSYPERDGVTARIAELAPGDAVEITEPFGAIHDRGPGVFIAGGAGVTPFIPILRRRAMENALEGCMLIFSNKRERDIILRQEWEGMHDLLTIFTVTAEPTEGLPHARIDRDFLAEAVKDFDQTFYVCGPPKMVDDVTAALRELGAEPDTLTLEE
jgi:ferredoxin-NADP reductase